MNKEKEQNVKTNEHYQARHDLRDTVLCLKAENAQLRETLKEIEILTRHYRYPLPKKVNALALKTLEVEDE